MDEIFVLWEHYTKPEITLTFDEVFTEAEVVGKVNVRYQNKVWDTQAAGGSGAYVTWETIFQDFGGQAYPGPGVFGVDTSDYVVLTIHHDRLQ